MTASLTLLRTRFATPAATLLLSMLFLVLPAIMARAAVTIQAVKSDSGVLAWLVEDYSVPIINIQFAFDGGSSQDPAGKEGLANLMTGLFDEGAGDLDSEAFQTRLDDAGAEMGFRQTRDGIYGTMRMLADRKDEAFDLLRLAIQEPRFDQAPIDRIRAQVVAGIVAGERIPIRWPHKNGLRPFIPAMPIHGAMRGRSRASPQSRRRTCMPPTRRFSPVTACMSQWSAPSMPKR